MTPWTALWSFWIGRYWVFIWRSDAGVWGYHHDYYDGNWYCFGLGKLLHVVWGDQYEPGEVLEWY